MILPLALFLIALLNGCTGSHGLHRDALRAFLESQVDPAPTQPAVSPPNPMQRQSGPFRLALYFMHRDIPPPPSLRTLEWVSADTDLLASRLAPLQVERIVDGIFPLVDPTLRHDDVRMIRKAAARYGADAVLIIDGVGAVDRYQNGSAAFYATLIGAYLAQGTNIDALFMIRATLHDARSERQSAPQLAEGQAHTVGPAMLVEERQVLTQAKERALARLGQQMLEQLRGLSGPHSGPATESRNSIKD
jgi:hypothetical protein